MKSTFLWGAASLALISSPALAQEANVQGYPDQSGLDTPADFEQAQESTAPVVKETLEQRLERLEARLQQLEARNKELEAASSEVETRVQKVEVRAATSVQPGVAPSFADVGGNFSFKPRGTLQIDYAGYRSRAGGYDYSNGTDLRRGRLGFEGTAYKNFKWRVEAELVKGSVNMLDAYVQYALNPAWQITAGQHKPAFGLEANSSDAFNSFIERGMITNAFGAVGAERRIGLSLGYGKDPLYATVGVFGASEGVSRSVRADESYGVNGRIVWEPINEDGRVVHLGASGYHITNLGTAALAVEDRPGTRVDGGRIVSVSLSDPQDAQYLGAEAAVVYGPFSVQGEYGKLHVDRLGAAPSADFDGFNIFASWFLTGESRPFKNGAVDRLKPLANFDAASGGKGAIELLARYDELDLSDSSISPLQRKATSWTGGINWYLNPNIKWVLNYIRFKGTNSPLYILANPVAGAGARTAKGDAIATRLQLDF